MPLSLGEKLRQAREERGISISEVAEQTRISSLYLESIENNDYRPLPGGIFNKGFVRSYARYIGFDEQEALRDYSELVAGSEGSDDSENRVYRPEVLTDDHGVRSMGPSIVFAVIILALMTGGIIFLVKFLTDQTEPALNANAVANTNTANVNSNVTTNTMTPAPLPAGAITVELKAVAEPVWISYSVDGGSATEKTLEADESVRLEVRESIRVNYAKVKAGNLQTTVNGRRITTPAEGLEVTRSNVAQLLQPTPTPTPRPRVSPAATVSRPAPRPTAASTPRPTAVPTAAASPRRP